MAVQFLMCLQPPRRQSTLPNPQKTVLLPNQKWLFQDGLAFKNRCIVNFIEMTVCSHAERQCGRHLFLLECGRLHGPQLPTADRRDPGHHRGRGRLCRRSRRRRHRRDWSVNHSGEDSWSGCQNHHRPWEQKNCGTAEETQPLKRMLDDLLSLTFVCLVLWTIVRMPELEECRALRYCP